MFCVLHHQGRELPAVGPLSLHLTTGVAWPFLRSVFVPIRGRELLAVSRRHFSLLSVQNSSFSAFHPALTPVRFWPILAAMRRQSVGSVVRAEGAGVALAGPEPEEAVLTGVGNRFGNRLASPIFLGGEYGTKS